MNLYEILEEYLPDNYLEPGEDGETIPFNPSNFLSNTKDFFQAYDPFDEKMITSTSELAKSDIINQNMTGATSIKKSFEQTGVNSSDFNASLENYFSKI